MKIVERPQVGKCAPRAGAIQHRGKFRPNRLGISAYLLHSCAIKFGIRKGPDVIQGWRYPRASCSHEATSRSADGGSRGMCTCSRRDNERWHARLSSRARHPSHPVTSGFSRPRMTCKKFSSNPMNPPNSSSNKSVFGMTGLHDFVGPSSLSCRTNSSDPPQKATPDRRKPRPFPKV